MPADEVNAVERINVNILVAMMPRIEKIRASKGGVDKQGANVARTLSAAANLKSQQLTVEVPGDGLAQSAQDEIVAD